MEARSHAARRCPAASGVARAAKDILPSLWQLFALECAWPYTLQCAQARRAGQAASAAPAAHRTAPATAPAIRGWAGRLQLARRSQAQVAVAPGRHAGHDAAAGGGLRGHLLLRLQPVKGLEHGLDCGHPGRQGGQVKGAGR